MRSISNSRSIILADAHVHLHNCFNISQVLNAAWNNFQRAATRQTGNHSYIGVLFLTEIRSEQRFQELYKKTSVSPDHIYSSDPLREWTIYGTQESVSLLAKDPDNNTIIILAGRQIVTQENLEVLALISDQQFEDGQSLPDTLTAITAAGGMPVLPWGVGKWLGRRGKLVRQLLESDITATVCLGDNSGRPIFWPRPDHFKTAECKGIKVLPGTDPLPLTTELNRPGQFGFEIEGTLDPAKPGKSMKNLLLDTNTTIKVYGNLENPIRFFHNQWMLRFSRKQITQKVMHRSVDSSAQPNC